MTPPRRPRLLLATIITVSLALTTATQLDNNLAPFLTQKQYDRVTAAAEYVAAHGWTQPIVVALGSPGLYDWSLFRSYLGDTVGQTYVYYGKLQNAYFLVPPFNQTYYRAEPDLEIHAAQQVYAELTAGLGTNPAAIRGHAVVLMVPDSYSYTLSESFAPAYAIGDGVYVIPPNTLTDMQLNTWNLSAASDFTWLQGGAQGGANWSLGPWVLSSTQATQAFIASYSFTTSMYTSFTLRIHLFDQSRAYAPVTFLVDGSAVLTYSYKGRGPIWLSTSIGLLGEGQHTLEVVSGGGGSSVAVSLDVLQVLPY